ncbi:MAG TPA: hypothetical protein VGS57_01970 [Thermoanaerobaculia bacterium]|jgi:hypothetical protein|nr:hypothetical protein [Thermoanaerobaculia bacterium]
MSDNDHHPDGIAKRDSLTPLNACVHAALEHGVGLAQAFFEGRQLDPWLFAHIVRYGVLEHLPDAIVNVDDYGVTRNAMCGVEIHADGCSIRIWKKPRAEDEYLQPPGESEVRQSFYWQQIPLPFAVEQQLPQPDNLAYVWEALPSGTMNLFLVKPSGIEGIWKPGLFEWAVPVPHPAELVTVGTDFLEGDEDEDLDIDLPNAGSGGGEPNGGA